jgi:M6 family metalloprotease-like protein
MSNGKLNFTNVIAGPVTLSHPRQYYTETLLVEEALRLAVKNGLDLTQFDSRGEAIIDSMSFLYAGQTQYIGELWPHNYFIDLSFGGISTQFYMLASMGNSKEDLSIGTFCHECGHMLCRWPDLYDYGNRDGDFEKSAGLGYYCLMSAGNHNDNGRTPSPVCAYLRNLIGWCDKKISLNNPGQYHADHGDYGTILVYETGKINEYFIIENRSRIDLDSAIPSSGLAVYHCDPAGSNEWQGGTATKHYQCGLLQADGSLDLETNRDMGDENDLFSKMDGIALNHDTRPSSNMWDGTDSGLLISQISAPGKIISFNIGKVDQDLVIKKISMPSEEIPINNSKGLEDSIEIEEQGKVKRLQIDLDISHNNIANMRVEIISPTGRRAILHNRSGMGKKNLLKSYDSHSMTSLNLLVGQFLSGKWTLRIRDFSGISSGTLNKWRLVATC